MRCSLSETQLALKHELDSGQLSSAIQSERGLAARMRPSPTGRRRQRMLLLGVVTRQSRERHRARAPNDSRKVNIPHVDTSCHADVQKEWAVGCHCLEEDALVVRRNGHTHRRGGRRAPTSSRLALQKGMRNIRVSIKDRLDDSLPEGSRQSTHQDFKTRLANGGTATMASCHQMPAPSVCLSAPTHFHQRVTLCFCVTFREQLHADSRASARTRRCLQGGGESNGSASGCATSG